MSSGFWQTKRRSEQFEYGGSITQKIENYVKTWEGRCYLNGIPDEVPKKVQESMRAPSYKTIAIAILSNDHCLKGLGFSGKQSDLWKAFKCRDDQQKDIFNDPA